LIFGGLLLWILRKLTIIATLQAKFVITPSSSLSLVPLILKNIYRNRVTEFVNHRALCLVKSMITSSKNLAQ